MGSAHSHSDRGQPQIGSRLGHRQLAHLLHAHRLQARLEVSHPHDPLEQEADRVSDTVLRTSTPEAFQAGETSLASRIQRLCPQCEERLPRQAMEEEEEPLPRAKREGTDVEEGASAIEPYVDGLHGRGETLAPATRAFFEPRFGVDFGSVRVHRDSEADRSARSIQALAYTAGDHIVFRAGCYDPTNEQGKQLLAHELVHVVQQGSADVNRATTIQRDTPPATHNASVGSISWIDSASPAGSHVTDPAPPAVIAEPFITGLSGFRFSNYLHAWVSTTDSAHVSGSGFHLNSNIYHGASYRGIPSWSYPMQQNTAHFTESGVEGVEFEQVVGARTISPGVIGGTVGAGVGAAAGAWGGAKIGAAIGAFGGPIGALGGALIGAGVGALGGYLVGTAVASRVTNFPPIWTKLKLRLRADGNRRCDVVQHSLFPSSSYYCDLIRWSQYDALASEQHAWEASGWDAGNPWGVSRPLFTP